MSRILLALLTCLLIGCAATDRVDDDLARFLGKNVKDATEELGRPTSVHNLQNGTWHYVWLKKSRYAGTGTSVMGITLSEGKQRECRRVLVVDRQKMVVNFESGGKC